MKKMMMMRNRRLVIKSSYGLEVWKDIPQYEGLYQVSTLGNVKSLNYRHTGESRVLKGNLNRGGYLMVNLYKDGKKKPRTVHKLVAEAWLPSRTSVQTDVNHIDENKQNNRVENLMWTTHEDNCNWGTHNERSAKARINHPKRSKPVVQFDKQGNLIAEHPSASEAERVTGIFQGGISSCCNGRCKTCGGFIWRYV